MKIIGYTDASFDSKDGKHIEGTRVFLTGSSPDVTGDYCQSVWVPKDRFAYKIDDQVQVAYTRKGKAIIVPQF